MGFLRRLGWYLVGLSIGIIFLVFFFKKKSDETDTEFCYFPNCRVLKDMRSKPLVFGDNLEARFRDTVLIRSFLQDGDIDFGRSDTESKPCKTYVVKMKQAQDEIQLIFKNCSGEVIVESKFKEN
ncbi:hypothetical protein [Flagellimonas meridianipacifica]|uniref:DUF4258 domain-containing protein n=1 Tax=Flagellimonas meridianipacifica TaxID=1080225 RepID=A0A2T0MC48_9FLAO|nr:hypothetical protein [Allomuricauda pacifica]PRX55068.1 hypothetical protein CLV81_3474 [Allomuricauda pacifica]